MHLEAHEWVALHADYRTGIDVLDIGGRNINGDTRDCFPNGRITALDIGAGDGVDIVADAGTWKPDKQYDVVVCTEVFEHAENWRDICNTAYDSLWDGGYAIFTMAGPGRPEHSAIDGGFQLHNGEYYGNVEPADLEHALRISGFTDINVDQRFAPCDVRATARKPNGNVRRSGSNSG